jgi:hypothetical protein
MIPCIGIVVSYIISNDKTTLDIVTIYNRLGITLDIISLLTFFVFY